MPGRNVGSIEITVDANTGKLRAQIVPEAKRVGNEAGDALSSGLNNIDTTELKAKIAKLAVQIERELESVDPELNIDTSEAMAEIERLRGQLAAISDEKIRVEFEGNLDVAQVNAEFQAMREEMEHERVDINLHIDMQEALFEALADVEAAKLQAERDEWEFHAEIDTILAEAEALRLKESLERDAITFKAEMDLKKATLALFAFKKRTEADDVQLAIELDTLQASIEADRFRLQQTANELGLDVDMDLATANAEMAAFRERQELDAVEVPVHIEEPTGDGGGLGFLTSGGWRKQLAQVGLAMGDQLGLLLEGTLSAATQLASSAFSALGGAVGAAAPMMVALGASVGTLIVGFQGMGDALGAVNDEFAAATAEGRAFNMNAEDIQSAMKNLAPAARDVVSAFAELMPQFNQIRSVIQGRLFAGLGDELRSLGETAIPAIGRGLAGIATELNQFFRELSGKIGATDWSGIFAGLRPVVDNMLRLFSNLFDTVEPFLKAAAPAAQALSDALADGAKNLAGMVQAGAASGGLTKFLMEGVESLKEWGRLLVATGKALFTLFEAGKAGGDGMVASLTAIVNKWNEWMKSDAGQAALLQFFQTGRDVMSALVPVLQGLKGMFQNLVTPDTLARFQQLTENIGQVLPVLGELLNALGRVNVVGLFAEALSMIAEAIHPIMPLVQELGSTLGTGLGQILKTLQPGLNALGDGLGQIIKAATPLIPVIAEVGAMIGTALSKVLQAAGPLFGVMADYIGEVVAAIKPLLPSLGRVIDEAAKVGVILLKAWTPIIANNIESILSVIEALVPVIELVLRVLAPLLQLFGVLAQVVGTVEGALSGFGSTIISTVADAFGTVIEKINEFLDLLSSVPIVSDVLDFIGISSGSDQITASLNLTNDALGKTATGTGIFGSAVEKMTGIVDGSVTQVEKLPPSLEDVAKAAGMSDKAFTAFESSAAEVADSIGAIEGPVSKTTEGLREIAKAADEGAEAADAMTEAFDKLITPQLNVNEAVSGIHEAMRAMNESFKEGAEAGKAFGGGVDLATEAGSANAATIRDGVTSLLDWADAALRSGTSSEDVAAGMGAMREGLIDTASQFFATREEAEAYVNSLGLTPEAVETSVLTPGLLQAMTDITGYDRDLDGILDSVDTTISTPGLEAVRKQLEIYGVDLSQVPDSVLTQWIAENLAPVTAQTDALGNKLTTMDGQVVSPEITVPTAVPADAEIAGVQQTADTLDGTTSTVTTDVTNNLVVLAVLSAIESQMKNLNGMKAAPTVSLPSGPPVLTQIAQLILIMSVLNTSKAAPQVTLPTYATVVAQIAAMAVLLGALGRISATPSVSISNYGVAIAQIAAVSIALGALDRYTASPGIVIDGVSAALNNIRSVQSALDNMRDRTVTIRTNNVTTTTGGMAGTLINGPRNMNVGERGYSEALVPLQLPLNRVNPDVREMAELLRSGPTPVASPGASKVVNNYMTVTTAADPVAAAAEIVNRSVVLANRG